MSQQRSKNILDTHFAPKALAADSLPLKRLEFLAMYLSFIKNRKLAEQTYLHSLFQTEDKQYNH